MKPSRTTPPAPRLAFALFCLAIIYQLSTINSPGYLTLMSDTNGLLAGITNLTTPGSLSVTNPATGQAIILTNGDANGLDGNFSRSITTTNLTATNINVQSISSSSSSSTAALSFGSATGTNGLSVPTVSASNVLAGMLTVTNGAVLQGVVTSTNIANQIGSTVLAASNGVYNAVAALGVNTNFLAVPTLSASNTLTGLLTVTNAATFQGAVNSSSITNQIAAAELVTSNGVLGVAAAAIPGHLTNAVFSGPANFPAGSDVAFARTAITSLANGNNADIQLGTNDWCELSGNSAAVYLAGFTAQPNRDGAVRHLLYRGGYPATIGNLSGIDSVPANRVQTMTLADRYSAGPFAAELRYSGASACWMLTSFESISSTGTNAPITITSPTWIGNLLVADAAAQAVEWSSTNDAIFAYATNGQAGIAIDRNLFIFGGPTNRLLVFPTNWTTFGCTATNTLRSNVWTEVSLHFRGDTSTLAGQTNCFVNFQSQ